MNDYKEIDVETVQEIAPGEFVTSVVVGNELGLHARPAALVAQTAQQYAAQVHLIQDTRFVDAKSILDILSLAAGKGTELIVRAKGEDAVECIKSIADLIRRHAHEGQP